MRPAGGRVALKTGLVSLAVLAAAACAFILGWVMMANIVGIPELADLGGYQPLRGNLVLLLVALPAVWVVSSFGEEVIYRGFLITRLAESWGDGPPARRWAVVVGAVTFGLVHFQWGPMGMVQTAFMGLALGVAYLVTGRALWPLVLAHACMDTVLLIQLALPVS